MTNNFNFILQGLLERSIGFLLDSLIPHKLSRVHSNFFCRILDYLLEIWDRSRSNEQKQSEEPVKEKCNSTGDISFLTMPMEKVQNLLPPDEGSSDGLGWITYASIGALVLGAGVYYLKKKY